MDPERLWGMLQNLAKSNGDTVDFGAIPPDVRAAMRGMAERMGSLPLPESGTMTKAQFMDFYARSESVRNSRAMGGPPGGPGFQPPGFQQWGNPNDNGWDNGDRGDRNGRGNDKKQEEKPVAIRYGKLPKGLPDWFEEYDVDKDGQVALWEWRKAGRPTAEFTEMDLDSDGLIAADELLRFEQIKTDNARIAALNAGEDVPAGGRGPGGGRGGRGGRGGDAASDSDKSASDKSGSDNKGRPGAGAWGNGGKSDNSKRGRRN
jgi:hypothetical protein